MPYERFAYEWSVYEHMQLHMNDYERERSAYEWFWWHMSTCIHVHV